MLTLFDEPTVPSAETNETLTGAKEEKTAQSIIAPLNESNVNALFWHFLLHAIRLSEKAKDNDNTIKVTCILKPEVFNDVCPLLLTRLSEYLPENISLDFAQFQSQSEVPIETLSALPVLTIQGKTKTKYTVHTADYLEKWVSKKHAQHTRDKASVNINSIESILQPHICPDFKEAYAQLEIMKKYTYACMENNPVLKNSYADFYHGIRKMYEALSSEIQAQEKEILTHTTGSEAYQSAYNELKARIRLTKQIMTKASSVQKKLVGIREISYFNFENQQECKVKKILLQGAKDFRLMLLSSSAIFPQKALSHPKMNAGNKAQTVIDNIPTPLQRVYRTFEKIIYTLQHPVEVCTRSLSFFAKKIGLKKEEHGESIEKFTALSAQLGK